jgi:hypothetical protein
MVYMGQSRRCRVCGAMGPRDKPEDDRWVRGACMPLVSCWPLLDVVLLVRISKQRKSSIKRLQSDPTDAPGHARRRAAVISSVHGASALLRLSSGAAQRYLNLLLRLWSAGEHVWQSTGAVPALRIPPPAAPPRLAHTLQRLHFSPGALCCRQGHQNKRFPSSGACSSGSFTCRG